MPPRIRQYDELGFPVPGSFDDLSMPDRDAAVVPAGANASRPKGASRAKRIVLGLMLVGVIALAAIPWLKDVGQGLLGDWLAQRARQKFNDGDMPGTVVDSTRAFTFLGEELDDARRIELLLIRGCAKLETHDLDGCLADFDRVLTSPKAPRDLRVYCYQRRSWANCRLQNYAAAVADASAAVQLNGPGGRFLPVLLNQRAYIRALANAGKQEVSQQELEAGLQDVERAIAMTVGENPAYIDTRGYLLHLLGRHDEALHEMNRAIDLTVTARQRVYSADDLKRFKEDLAVMHYHRGLIHDALGLKDKAIEDLERADEYGYNPEAGVL